MRIFREDDESWQMMMMMMMIIIIIIIFKCSKVPACDMHLCRWCFRHDVFAAILAWQGAIFPSSHGQVGCVR